MNVGYVILVSNYSTYISSEMHLMVSEKKSSCIIVLSSLDQEVFIFILYFIFTFQSDAENNLMGKYRFPHNRDYLESKKEESM